MTGTPTYKQLSIYNLSLLIFFVVISSSSSNSIYAGFSSFLEPFLP